MHSLQFWKSWTPVYRRLFLFLAVVFLSAVMALLVAFFKSPAPAFTWQQQQELQLQKLPVFTFDVGGFDLTISTNNHIVFERWNANPIQIHIADIDLYFMFLALALAMIMSVFTVLKKFWFFASMGLLIFVFSSFRWDGLLLFGFENQIPSAVILALVIGLSLFYQYFRMTAAFIERFVAFSFLLALLGYAVTIFSGVHHPIRYLAVSTLPASMVILVVFMIMVAHEIIAGFVTLSNQGSSKSKHVSFLIISGIYLLNLWLAYLNRIGTLHWELSMAPVLVLIASSILSIWGIRQRQPQFQRIISADPFAVYFIISMATIALAVTGYFFSSSLDIAILTINDLILFTHIGYGMVFLAYVGSNFLNLMMDNLPVQKVLYKPTALPYFTYRFAGLIFTSAFVLYNTWSVPITHFVSAHETALGDYYYSEGNPEIAASYYKRGFALAPYNQHTATILAQLDGGQSRKAAEYLFNANQFMPTEFTIMNYDDMLHYAGKNIDEVIFLEQAVKASPQSDILKNNLGLAYSRIGVNDSAYAYFSQARKTARMEATADMNLLGLLANNKLSTNPDSIYQLLQLTDDRVKSNALAIANEQGKLMDLPLDLPKDSVLNLFSATLIGNYLTNQFQKLDTVLLSTCIAYARKKENRNYKSIILIPASRLAYAAGKVNQAYVLLQELIIEGSEQGKNSTTLAQWSLHQQKPQVAASYIQYAVDQHDPQASWILALTLAENGKIDQSVIAWDSLSHRKDSALTVSGESMKRILAAPPTWYGSLTDPEKYRYLRYRIALSDSSAFDRLLGEIQNEDLKAKAILDRAEKWYTLDQSGRALKIFNKLQGLHLTDLKLFAEIKYFELSLFASRGKLASVREQIQKGIAFGPYRECERVYFEALQQIAAGDSTGAVHNFKWLAYANSYYDDGIVASANYFKGKKGRFASYSILSEAIQVNSGSAKILKAYILCALNEGYDSYAISALKTLETVIPADDYRKYVSKNQLQGLLLP